MTLLYDLITNEILITALCSWGIAQIAKVLLHALIYRKFELSRLFGDGGMPSGHSATVVSMATLSAYMYGLGSFEFAVCMMLAIIVCHDAMGVRLETGKQAVILKEIIHSMDIMFTDEVAEIKLKEFVGHTMNQVAVGAAIGVASASVVYWIFLH